MGSSAEGIMADEEETERPLEGFNEQDYPDGSRYEGNFVAGQRDGQGKLVWADKCGYEGEFKDGRRHGRGRFFWTNGSGYEGIWANGKQKGKGEYFWDDVVMTEDGIEERTTRMRQAVLY